MGHSDRHSGHGDDSARADSASADSPHELTERDRQILAFERDWAQHIGAKEEAIRLEFGVSPARYYQLLRTLVDSPAALVHDPMLIKRLQRLRDARSVARASRLHTVAGHD